MLHEKLKQIREKSGLNQVEFSETIGISPATYNGYEQGKQFPKADVLKNICEKYNVSADWLLDIETTTRLETWGDLANMLNQIFLDYDLVFEAEVVDYDGNIQDTFSIALIPYSWLSDFFRKKRQMRKLTKNMPELFSEWIKGVLSEPPLTNDISKDSFIKFINDLQELNYKYSSNLRIRINSLQFDEIILSPEDIKLLENDKPEKPNHEPENDTSLPFDL